MFVFIVEFIINFQLINYCISDLCLRFKFFLFQEFQGITSSQLLEGAHASDVPRSTLISLQTYMHKYKTAQRHLNKMCQLCTCSATTFRSWRIWRCASRSLYVSTRRFQLYSERRLRTWRSMEDMFLPEPWSAFFFTRCTTTRRCGRTRKSIDQKGSLQKTYGWWMRFLFVLFQQGQGMIS